MYQGSRTGWLEVISGVMFSGKSEELIRRVRRAIIARRTVQVFKSHLDGRYAGVYNVTSHDGTEIEAIPVDSSDEILRQVRPATEIVAIDEAQFLDRDIVAVTTVLAQRGVRVILAGTDTDFRGEPFGADGRPHGRGGNGGQAARHLHGVRRCGLPEPAAGRRPAGALGLADDHGGRAGERTRRAAGTATGCRAQTKTRRRCS